MPSVILLKRAYEVPSEKDGCRILVERLWPRGLRKADAARDPEHNSALVLRDFLNRRAARRRTRGDAM
ncbi:MAG: DUF488 family protein [Candidatus Eremiobacteraeota bacterium]|nr:DUF488 family protein [Candidatus Eremiobacteraeota bacterium]